MNLNRLLLAFPVKTIRGGNQSQGCFRGGDSVFCWIGLLEDGHKAVSHCFIDMPAFFGHFIEEGGKISFDQIIQGRGGQQLAQTRIAGYVEK